MNALAASTARGAGGGATHHVPAAQPGLVAGAGGVALSLAATCAPAAWAGGRWPHEDWIAGAYWRVDRERGRTIWRRLVQRSNGALLVEGSPNRDEDGVWFDRICRPPVAAAVLPADSVVRQLAQRFPSAGTLCGQGLFDGLVTSIVGQSISLASAAVTLTRLALLFHPGIVLAGRRFVPLPDPAALADANPAVVRGSGVTTRRAEVLCRVARMFAAGSLPDRPAPDELPAVEASLLALPGIGPWTVASALLWGLGHEDAHPGGDVALLRAARLAYDAPAMMMGDLDRLADGWRPHRAVVARLLWLNLFGPASAGGAA